MFWGPFVSLSDEELLRAADQWAADDRKRTLDILCILIAVDDRDLPGRRGYPTLFKFCVERLRFAEAAAYWRIRAARAAKDHPRIATLLGSGEMNITTVALLSPYLTAENCNELASRAAGKTRREIEALIASLSPSAARRDIVTRRGPMIVARAQWPAPATSPDRLAQGNPPGAPPAMLDIVEAIDSERRRLHFDVGPETAQLLERAREILRHKFPFASLEDIVREALNVLLDYKDLDRAIERRRQQGPAAPKASEPAARAIPTWVRRAVWRRDAGRCAYVGEGGKKCGERSWLEFDHVVPFAKGGRSDDPANVRLLCRAHNQLEAARAFAPPRAQ